MFYLLGSLLFALAMMAAFTVMITNFAQHRRAMMRALRSLSMDGFAAPASQAQRIDAFRLQAGVVLRQPQAAA
jgi:hypothetical protein